MDELEEFEFRHRLEKEKAKAPATFSQDLQAKAVDGMSFGQTVAAGAGKALTDIGRGGGQMLGMVSRADIDEARKRDAPLMASGAGKAGFIGGGLVPLAALSITPGANTIAGSALMGAGLGALEPVGTDESRAVNMSLGGATGGGSAGLFKVAGAGAANWLGKSQTQALSQQSKNAVRDMTLKSAQDEGYVLPGSVIGGGRLNKLAESVGGKADVGVEATIRNQQVTNKIARREAGLGADEPISEKTLGAARDAIAAPYREVGSLSPRAQTALDGMKEARNEAKLHWREYDSSNSVSALKEAQKFDARAKSYERVIDAEAKRLGRPDLLPALQDARVRLAKNYDVERALNLGNGNVEARIIGRMLDKRGEDAVTGGLQTIGKFAESYSHFVRNAEGLSTGVSKLGPMASVALGAMGAGTSEYTTGTPYGAAAGLIPLMAGPARSIALSNIMRPGMAYNAGVMPRLSNFATNNPRLQSAIPLSAVGSVLDAQQ